MTDVATLSTLELLRLSASNSPWRPGLPPGKYYEGMVDDFEVFFSVIGRKLHRRRTPEQKAAYLELLRRNREACSQ
jgi:hypothetical protein